MPTKEEMLAEKIRQRKMAEQFGDMEFQMDIAPNLNYKGPIDPRAARIRQTDLDRETELRGYRIPSVQEYSKDYVMSEPEAAEEIANTELRTRYLGTGIQPQLPVEAGTVNVVGARNATPTIWSHEYRHAQGLGTMDENLNRKIDAWNAQNSRQWDDAVEMERYRTGTDGKPASREKAEGELMDALKYLDNNYPKQWEKHKDKFVPNPYWKRRK
jgi:hypothetical protein